MRGAASCCSNRDDCQVFLASRHRLVNGRCSAVPSISGTCGRSRAFRTISARAVPREWIRPGAAPGHQRYSAAEVQAVFEREGCPIARSSAEELFATRICLASGGLAELTRKRPHSVPLLPLLLGGTALNTFASAASKVGEHNWGCGGHAKMRDAPPRGTLSRRSGKCHDNPERRAYMSRPIGSPAAALLAIVGAASAQGRRPPPSRRRPSRL